MDEVVFWTNIWLAWTVLTFLLAAWDAGFNGGDLLTEWFKGWWMPVTVPIFLLFIVLPEWLAFRRASADAAKDKE